MNRYTLHVLQELGGWRTITMIQRYAHLSPGHLAEHADAVNGWRGNPVAALDIVK